jgi:regulator of protease activity HflC (stomatin/prohibitin superfamily)
LNYLGADFSVLFACARKERAMMDVLLVIALVVILILLSGLRIVQEYERAVVFRLGRYKRIAGPGLYWIIPLLIERQQTIDTRTTTVGVEPQETITKDSVTIRVNAVLWFRVVDSSRAVIAVRDYRSAVYQVALTTLRNIIGQHVLDEVLRDRDTINATLKQIIDTATEPWGIEVEMVEMAEAIREKRARIIKAEAEQEASQKLSEASKLIVANPAALELRRMQMISEVGAEQNTTTIIMMPSDFVMLAKNLSESLSRGKDVGKQ